jgi:hypothetical protein
MHLYSGHKTTGLFVLKLQPLDTIRHNMPGLFLVLKKLILPSAIITFAVLFGPRLITLSLGT